MTRQRLTMDVLVPLALALALAFAVVVVLGYLTARSEPLPYPKSRDGQCSSGYMQSGGFCVPQPGGHAREAVPKPRGAQCPSGWAQSGDACERVR